MIEGALKYCLVDYLKKSNDELYSKATYLLEKHVRLLSETRTCFREKTYMLFTKP